MTESGRQSCILIVDDDPDVRSVLRQALEQEGYSAEECSDRTSVFRCLETHPIHLITLDLTLGDNEDGLEFAREIRTRYNIPIMMITGRDHPLDRVQGLEYGADDYVAKPFHLREVVLRVHRLLARYNEPDGAADHLHGLSKRFSFDHLCLDPARRELRRVDGTLLDLTGLEFQLIDLFLRHPGRVLSRDEITRMLKGHDWSPYDRTIDGHIARLRRKIEPNADEPTMIKSVRGVGYVFTGVVSTR